MKKVLVLGAGLVSRPLVRYLMDVKDFRVTVASRTISKAEALIEGHENGTALPLNVENDEKVEKLISEHDLVVSLLPYTYHVKVAKFCIKHRKHLATTSYVSDTMKQQDDEAKEAGVILLNEIGVDPGIDHMSAMKIIHEVKRQGGKVTSFQSYCGGLPAPEANDNPFGYKFSWSPRGVLMAGKNSALYLKDGEIVEIDGKDLFDNFWTLEIPGAGLFEGYPNRDCLGYIDLYGLEGIKTMFRGTLRNIGWCNIIKRFVQLGMLDDKPDNRFAGLTYNEFMGELIGRKTSDDVKQEIAGKLGIDADSPEINAMSWLGLFSEEAIPEGVITAPLDILTDIMLRKMAYKKGERDMIVLHHMFTAEFSDRREEITSTLIDFGIPGGDSSMARTVSLPCAIGVRLILEGEITRTGVQIPVIPDIYEPVLRELENLNIKFLETKKVLTLNS